MNASFHCLDKWPNETVESGRQRPNELYEELHNSPSVVVWCAISKNEVAEPYFIENEKVTGTTY